MDRNQNVKLRFAAQVMGANSYLLKPVQFRDWVKMVKDIEHDRLKRNKLPAA